MSRDQRGFTLIEMLIVTVLGSLVLIAALQVLITNQRTYTAQTAVISGQQGLRSGSEILFNELRMVSASGGDILMMHQDSIRVRLMRKFSRVCDTAGITAATPVVNVFDPSLSPFGANASIDFVPTDSVFIYADNDERDDDDDAWIAAQVTAVAVGLTTAPCQINDVPPFLIDYPGVQLTFSGQQAKFIADSVRLGAPVRSWQTVRYALVSRFGDWYLGRAVGTGALTPVAGPLRQAGGLQFAFRDSLNATTAVPAEVRQIGVTLRSSSTVLNSLNRPISDSISTWIYTRN